MITIYNVFPASANLVVTCKFGALSAQLPVQLTQAGTGVVIT